MNKSVILWKATESVLKQNSHGLKERKFYLIYEVYYKYK